MTGHDTGRNGPLDRGITAAIDGAEATVPDTTHDVLVARAREARDHDRKRRRRTVRILTGAAAAVVLIVAAIAIAANRGGDDTRIASSEVTGMGSADSGAQVAVPEIVVDPSADLVDGQTVTLTVKRGVFDPGTPVSAMQCATGSVTAPTCARSTITSLGVMPADEGELVGPFTVSTGSSATEVYRPGETPGVWYVDPTADAAPPLSCAAVTSRGRATGSADHPAPDPDGPTVPDHADDAPTGAVRPDSAGESETGTTPAPGGAAVAEPAEPGTSPSGERSTPMTPAVRGLDEPCVIAVFGITDGRSRAVTAPLSFAPTDDTPHASDDGTVGSPVQPDEGPPQSSIPQGASPLCSPLPDAEPFTGDPGPDGPLIGFDPDSIVACSIGVDGTVVAWDISGRDAASLVGALNALEPARADQACTDEMGPRIALIATADGRSTTVWLELYGCGTATDGERFRTGAKTLPLPVP